VPDFDRDMGALPLRFHHNGVVVADLNRAIAWYERVLGFQLERRATIAAVGALIAIVRKGDMRFELFEVPGAADLPDDRRVPNRDLLTQGNKHVCFQVENLAEALEELRRRGADIAYEYQGRAAFIRDDSGNLIEFLQPVSETSPPR
jgi:methylmalonyl-CoA/ethylmalonyl-CoA epimerase